MHFLIRLKGAGHADNEPRPMVANLNNEPEQLRTVDDGCEFVERLGHARGGPDAVEEPIIWCGTWHVCGFCVCLLRLCLCEIRR